MKNLNFKWLLLSFVLSITSLNPMWAAESTKQDKGQANKQPDTAYIITPTISTQDTIYLKHEDVRLPETWWGQNGGNLIQALLVLLLGAGITWLTSTINAGNERKRKKQDKIVDDAIKIEKQIYTQIIAVRNAQDTNNREQLLDHLSVQLQEAELTMRTPLYLAASNILNFYRENKELDVDTMSLERDLLEDYKRLFSQQA